MNKNFVILECTRLAKTHNYARIHRASCYHARAPNYKTASARNYQDQVIKLALI